MPSQMKRGKKKADFIVLKRGLPFCSLLLLFQKASYLFKAHKAIAGYLHQLMSGVNVMTPLRTRWPNQVVRRERLLGEGRELSLLTVKGD